MLMVLLLLVNLKQPPLIGGDIASDANPTVLMAAPALGQRIYLKNIRCVSVDGVDDSSNTVSLNDANNTTLQLPAREGLAAEKSFSPPLQGPVGAALTFKVSQPSVVKCLGAGYAGP